MPGISEIFEHAVRYHLTDILNLKQLFFSGSRYGIDIPEMPGYLLGRGLSDITDAKREQHVIECHLFDASRLSRKRCAERSFQPSRSSNRPLVNE